ncbi:SGNH hydrolase domain-containing protein [Sphingomonas sp.]|uniref:SGNH hydrolase domain-containing protein n=1 Tax=Sphingomonas sp. TaxID=28214 RepID=UPI003B3BE130
MLLLDAMPDPKTDLPWSLAIAQIHERTFPVIQRGHKLEKVRSRFSLDPGVRFFSYTDALCQPGCPLYVGDSLLFIDDNHISASAASHIITPAFAPGLIN